MRRALAVGIGLTLWCAACTGTSNGTEPEPDAPALTERDTPTPAEPGAPTPDVSEAPRPDEGNDQAAGDPAPPDPPEPHPPTPDEPEAQAATEPDPSSAVLPDPSTPDGPDVEPLSSSQIRRLVEGFVDEDRQSIGVVVGATSAAGRVVVGHGRLSADDPTRPDGDTVFEIGSITKVFTSTVLADLVSRQELGLDTPVRSLLGDGVRMPTRDGAEITLGHLATHSSGLPRLPANFVPEDPTNPYADYTVDHLHEFLASHELARDIGAAVEYSNLGYGLLGHALALREGTGFETLVYDRILDPLEMPDTAVELTPALRERLAPGHDGQLRPAANWELPVLAGAGALRSTVNDLLTFLEANLGLRESPLGEAMALAHTPRRRDDALGMDIGLGWIIATDGDRRFVWHNGGTGGYASFLAFDPDAGEGIVILSNSSLSVDFLAYRLFTRDLDE